MRIPLLPVGLYAVLLLAAAASIAKPAFAEDDAADVHAIHEALLDFASPEDTFRRTQAVLAHFGVAEQADPQTQLDALSGLQSSSNMRALLKYFDPGNEFSKYTSFSSEEVRFYQDRQGHSVSDFSASLRDPAVKPATSELESRLIAAQSNPPARPLLGLRIALDPGHMGGSQWDGITGKWVRDTQSGRYLSEGVLNLQTALLLEASLTRLGARVMVTRHDLVPVTSQGYDDFDLQAGALRALRESTLLGWFQELLSVNPIGAALFDSFSRSPSFQEVFSDINRWTYYNDLDLQARVDAIEAFHPDITLIIHYDTSTSTADPHGLQPGPAGTADATKVYVPGAFDPTELASRDDRAQFAMHLLDQSAWDASVSFARAVATTLSVNLNIPFAKSSPGLTRVVEPGIFSRDLYLLKKYQGSATAYVECLFYNDPGEFDALYSATHPMTIAGQNMPYSDRLALVADSLKQAIVKFVQP